MRIDLLAISNNRIKKLQKRLDRYGSHCSNKELHALERMLRKEQAFNKYLRDEDVDRDEKLRQITWGLFDDKEQLKMFEGLMKNLPLSLRMMMPLLSMLTRESR